MFVCIASAHHRPLSDGELERYSRRLHGVAGEAKVAYRDPGFTALTAPRKSPLRSLVAQQGHLVGIGNVRLENADEVARWSPVSEPHASHLALVVRAVEQRGLSCIPALLGDFAFVIWNRVTREVVAARDALGVKTLFIRTSPGVTSLASLAWLIADDATYDTEFIADSLVGGDPQSTRTSWCGVEIVHGGHVLLLRDGYRPQLDRFWSPYAFEPAGRPGSAADVERFKELFTNAVRSCITVDTWSELSGGLDSSSIVSLGKALFEAGQHDSDILGTVSLFDELGEGDERRYSDAVIERYGCRNELLCNYWAWQDDGRDPVLTDGPTMLYPFFARDRRMSELVRDAGVRVLLSGMGSDHYLWGNQHFLTDGLMRGDVAGTLSSVASWAVAQRQSFWRTLWRDVLRPMVGRARWRLRGASERVIPPWITSAFARKSGIAARHWEERKNGFELGGRFVRDTADGIVDLPLWLLRDPYEDGFERRYPFLSRPLVEHALSLPIALRAHPTEPKVVLREVMRGVLPESIRRRQGKGGIDSRYLWSLSHERDRIAEMLRDPILAQLGCIDPAPLRAAVKQSWSAHKPDYPTLLRALALETWLHVREGKWTTVTQRAGERPDPGSEPSRPVLVNRSDARKQLVG